MTWYRITTQNTGPGPVTMDIDGEVAGPLRAGLAGSWVRVPPGPPTALEGSMTAGRLILTALALIALFLVIVVLAGVAHAYTGWNGTLGFLNHVKPQMVYCCR